MYRLKLFSTIFVLLLVGYFFISCSNSDNNEPVLRGAVHLGAAIEGSEVEVRDENGELLVSAEDVVGLGGTFIISLPFPLPPDFRIRVTVESPELGLREIVFLADVMDYDPETSLVVHLTFVTTLIASFLDTGVVTLANRGLETVIDDTTDMVNCHLGIMESVDPGIGLAYSHFYFDEDLFLDEAEEVGGVQILMDDLIEEIDQPEESDFQECGLHTFQSIEEEDLDIEGLGFWKQFGNFGFWTIFGGGMSVILDRIFNRDGEILEKLDEINTKLDALDAKLDAIFNGIVDEIKKNRYSARASNLTTPLSFIERYFKDLNWMYASVNDCVDDPKCSDETKDAIQEFARELQVNIRARTGGDVEVVHRELVGRADLDPLIDLWDDLASPRFWVNERMEQYLEFYEGLEVRALWLLMEAFRIRSNPSFTDRFVEEHNEFVMKQEATPIFISPEVILDTKHNLMWSRTVQRGATTRTGWLRIARDFRGAGFSDWRLESRPEVEKLFDEYTGEKPGIGFNFFRIYLENRGFNFVFFPNDFFWTNTNSNGDRYFRIHKAVGGLSITDAPGDHPNFTARGFLVRTP